MVVVTPGVARNPPARLAVLGQKLDVDRSGQVCVVVEGADDHAANTRTSALRAAPPWVGQILHLASESACKPLFRVLQLGEFPSGYHAAKVKTQLLGAGFHPHGIGHGSHPSDSAAPWAALRAAKARQREWNRRETKA